MMAVVHQTYKSAPIESDAQARALYGVKTGSEEETKKETECKYPQY